MKVTLTRPEGLWRFTGYGKGYVEIEGQRPPPPFLLWKNEILAWEVENPEGLGPDEARFLSSFRPDIVLLGTGGHFSPLAALAQKVFFSAGVGVEAMSTAALCRTYNFLAAEDRLVLAAVLRL